MQNPELILDRTAAIAAAHLSNNPVAVDDVPRLIAVIGAALAALGEPIEPEKPAPVNWRRTIKSDGLVSLIDGKPYKMLKRHIAGAGFTPDTYRAHFGLPADYPMVAQEYTERRRTIAQAAGLGHSPHSRRGARAR
jgi:predicted transcriptional regulator